jgi:methionyl-tRNA synthetase
MMIHYWTESSLPDTNRMEISEAEITIEDFMRVHLRVAQIESAEPIPKSKKLLKLQVDLGEKLGKRQIVSGIAQHYSPEALVGRRIVVVANLKPANLMGEESRGMLLAASSEDNSSLLLVDPGQEMPLGTIVR